MKFRVLTDIDFGYKTVEFNYYPNQSVLTSGYNDKFFMTKVLFKDANNTNINEQFSFEYNDIENYPNNFSNSQDYLGFYNGKSNSSLLPKNSSKFLASYLQELGTDLDLSPIQNLINKSNFENYNSYLADREPYFEFASKGLLTKIIYPTGGYTRFQYEPVEKKFLYNAVQLGIYSNMGSATPGWVPNSKLSMNLLFAGLDLDEEGSTSVGYVFQDQKVSLDLNINTLSPTGLDYHDYVYVQLVDEVTLEIVEKKYYFPIEVVQYDNTQTNFKTTFTFSLKKGKSYRINMGFGDQYAGHITESNKNQFSSTPMHVNAGFDYIKGINQNDGLGLRIKRTLDYSSDTETPLVKRYYYDKMTNINTTEETINKVYVPLFHNFLHTNAECSYDMMGTPLTAITGRDYIVLNSNSVRQHLPNISDMYRNVTISYGGDDFEKGGVEKTFFIASDKHPKHYSPNGNNSFGNNFYIYANFKFLELDISSSRSNESVANGILLRESYWKKDNNNLFKVKDMKYSYAMHENFRIHNIRGQIVYPHCNYCFGNLFYGLYDTISFKPLLLNTTETNFIDAVPLSEYSPPVLYNGWRSDDEDNDGIINLFDNDFFNTDEEYVESNFKKVSSETNYDYFTPVLAGLPHYITTTNSIGEITETKNYYPITENINYLSSDLSSDDISSYNKLKEENRIEKPIQVETYKNNILLSKKRIIYRFLVDVLSTVFEHKIQISKGQNPLEDRIIYHKYDVKGNLVEFSLPDGAKGVYIWSFNRKLIYKIENTTYQEVLNAINNGGVMNPMEFDENDPQPYVSNNPFINLLPNAQVTIYNYTPVSQLLKSVIDPKGDMFKYEYDMFNRLIFVKDKDGNILSKSEYNYRPQN